MDNTSDSPQLTPFPSLEMSQLGNCSVFQMVQSIEIDLYGRLWAIDVGRVNIFGNVSTEVDFKCPPKLVLLDLTNNGAILRVHVFPNSVVKPRTNFLNDIAVACFSKESCHAYIPDAYDTKIVIYDYAKDTSYFVTHSSMLADPKIPTFTVLGQTLVLSVNIDGLAISPRDTDFSTVFFSPLNSFHFFSVPTKVLNSATNGQVLEDKDIIDLGVKESTSDGMIGDWKGILYYGRDLDNGISSFDTTQKITGNEILLAHSDTGLMWPDGTGFDDSTGHLYFVTNRLHKYLTSTTNFNEYNYRIVKIFTGSKSYQNSAKLPHQQHSQGIKEIFDKLAKSIEEFFAFLVKFWESFI